MRYVNWLLAHYSQISEGETQREISDDALRSEFMFWIWLAEFSDNLLKVYRQKRHFLCDKIEPRGNDEYEQYEKAYSAYLV
jgi:hypothetical protein